jgi:AraC-like DNA-binding protein
MSAALKEKRIVGTGSVAFADGFREPLHIHADYAQLKWPSTGVASVRTPAGIFVAGPAHAVWIPAGDRHAGIYTGEVLEQNLYIHKGHCAALPQRCCLVAVPPRLSRTIARALAEASEYVGRSRADDREILSVVEQEVSALERPPLDLPIPEASRIQLVVERLLQAPNDPRTLAAWARQVGMAERSLGRSFHDETGMSFGEWRKRARVLCALRRLATGADVATTAAELGYESTSAFVYMFRTTLGLTPARYYLMR